MISLSKPISASFSIKCNKLIFGIHLQSSFYGHEKAFLNFPTKSTWAAQSSLTSHSYPCILQGVLATGLRFWPQGKGAFIPPPPPLWFN